MPYPNPKNTVSNKDVYYSPRCVRQEASPATRISIVGFSASARVLASLISLQDSKVPGKQDPRKAVAIELINYSTMTLHPPDD